MTEPTKAAHAPSPDTVLRVNLERNFKRISCTALDDARLSYRAKGVHTYLITRPDGWKFYSGQVMSVSTDGKDAVRTALKELIGTGYLRINRANGARGRLIWKWEVAEAPLYHSTIGGKTIDGPAIDGSAIDGSTIDGESAPISKYVSKEDNTTEEVNIIADADAQRNDDLVPELVNAPPKPPKPETPWTALTTRDRFGKAWKAAYGEESEPPFARMGKAFRPIWKHGVDAVYERFVAYCDQVSAAYASPEKFAQTFGKWKPDPRRSDKLAAKEAIGPGRRF